MTMRQLIDMATSLLEEDLVIDTPEAVAALEEAFRIAESGEIVIPRRDVRICTDKEFIRRFIEDR